MSKAGSLKKMFLLHCKLVVFFLYTVACNEDGNNYVYPPIISELVEVHTNNLGVITQMLTDRGELLTIKNRIITTDNLTKDSVYRCSCRYTLDLEEPKEVTIYSLQQIPSSYPIAAYSIRDIKADPLSLQSIWIGGSYLNLALLVKSQGKNHSYTIVEDSLKAYLHGKRTLYLRLYHDAVKDIEAYTQTVYYSVPLYNYLHTLQKGDTIAISINTLEEGWCTWKECFL